MYTVLAEIQLADLFFFFNYLTFFFPPESYRFVYSFDSAMYRLDIAF